jgi:hypothetical protein
LPGASDQDQEGTIVTTPTVTERSVSLEATTRDDFADSPSTAVAPVIRPDHRFVPETRRDSTR